MVYPLLHSHLLSTTEKVALSTHVIVFVFRLVGSRLLPLADDLPLPEQATKNNVINVRPKVFFYTPFPIVLVGTTTNVTRISESL